MILITGATGHIGNALVRELQAEKLAIRVLVLPGEDVNSISGFNLEIVRGDITDYSSIKEAFSGISCVYHLAGMVSIGSGKKKTIFKVNVEGTRNVVRACLEKKAKRLVYTSSIHAFAEPPAGELITENQSLNEREVVGSYGKSKALATRVVLEAAGQGLEVIVAHPTGVIGPYEYQRSNMGQLILDFLNRRLYAYIDGSYDFVDVRDVARGLVLACEKGRNGENYILSGEQITVREILEYLEDYTGLPAPRIKIPLWAARVTAPLAELYYLILKQKPLYTPYSIYTLSSNSLTTYQKAAEELGYQPRPVKEALCDTVGWLRAAGQITGK